MIKRYSRKELVNIWEEHNKYKIWLNIEVAAAEGMEKLKIIPKVLNSSVGSLKVEEINYLNDNSWNDEIIDFTDIVLNNKKVITGNSYDALKVMELVENIYKSDSKL